MRVQSQFIEMYSKAHKKMTLESVCTIMGKGITPKYVDSSSVVVINQACVHWDGQHLENVKYHNKNVPVKKRTLETGDVLLNATGNGTLGRCCVFNCPSDENQYVNDGHVIALSTDKSVILPEVLNSYLSLSDTQSEIYRQYVTGSTNQIDIVFTDIKKMTVPVPNMREQLQFVSILQQADKSKFVGFKSQFIEMFGDPITNTKGWTEYGYIGNYAQIVLGSTPNSKNPLFWGGDIKWITPAEMSEESYYIYDTERHLTEEGLKSANLTLLPYKTVLFSTRAPIGKVGLAGSPMYCNQGFKNFICGNKLNPTYLYYSLIYKRDYLVSLGTGTTFKELSRKAVENLKIAVPPIERQDQFETIYKQADKSKYYN